MHYNGHRFHNDVQSQPYSPDPKMNISIAGCGHLGSVVAAGFAAAGHHVRCFDVHRKHFDYRSLPHEPGLAELVDKGAERLAFADRFADLLAHGQVLYFCLSAPSGDEGLIDVRSLLSSIERIKDTQGVRLFVKSTVPVGTCRSIQRVLEKNGNKDCRVVYEPEFTSEGTAVKDFLHARRRVFGCTDQAFIEPLLQAIYNPLDERRTVQYHCMSFESAELSKLALNSMLACRISFVNELANYASVCGAEVEHVVQVLCSDQRIGQRHLRPGIGYGGMCLPKDVASLCRQMQKSSGTAILPAVIKTNLAQPKVFFSIVRRRFSDLANRRIAFLGYSFKGGTSDTRGSLALDVLRLFMAERSALFVYDPKESLPDDCMSSCKACASMDEAVSNADCVVLGCDYPLFVEADWSAIAAGMRHAVMFDCRNCLDSAAMQKAGFEYYAVGRPPSQTV